MDNRPISIQHLFEILKDKPSFNKKLSITNNKLTIFIGHHFKIAVILNGDFYIYINDSLGYDAEEQDIVDFLTDIIENNYYVIEKKNVMITGSYLNNSNFFPCKRFEIISEKEYYKRKDKFLKKTNIKVFNHDEVIYDV